MNSQASGKASSSEGVLERLRPKSWIIPLFQSTGNFRKDALPELT
jgi:hypothetical protein